MGVRVNLPPGCSGFDCKDGTAYKARPGGTVEVSDDHARAINAGQYGDAGFITATNSLSFGTKRGRYCRADRRLWNAWNDLCPKCGGPTEEWAG